MIQSFPCRYKSKESISNFYFLKKVIFKEAFFAAQTACEALKTTYHAITFKPCSQKL